VAILCTLLKAFDAIRSFKLVLNRIDRKRPREGVGGVGYKSKIWFELKVTTHITTSFISREGKAKQKVCVFIN